MLLLLFCLGKRHLVLALKLIEKEKSKRQELQSIALKRNKNKSLIKILSASKKVKYYWWMIFKQIRNEEKLRFLIHLGMQVQQNTF
ncbi:hypothetical protein FBFR_01180 [Flavobacterium fryxellicola]|uniref:Uncharacterized protein n=1 Tax=Flavobacterium fryxellicola TaxID=249352 RepID=A0A162PDP7_9FLAO|nr:hypothetical protein FBFR_01180 [Flavobacterium fryxellicola]